MIVVDKIDTSILNQRMASLYDALLGSGQDVSTIVVDESRRLARTLVNFVPPIKSKWGNPKKSGEMAIRRELSSLFSEADQGLIDEVGSLHGIRNVNTWITNRNGGKQQILWDSIDPVGSRLRQNHHQARGPRGKIKLHKRNGYPQTWSARVVIPAGTLEPYTRNVESQVGKGKASLALAAAQLGEKFPSWIGRHFGNVSQTAIADISHATDPTRPSVTFGSRAPGVDRLQARMQGAVSLRAKKIAGRIRLVLSGYAADIKAGMRAQKRGKRTTQETPEAIE